MLGILSTHRASFLTVLALAIHCTGSTTANSAAPGAEGLPVAEDALQPACIGWDKAWVMYQYSHKDDKWSSWKSPPIGSLPTRSGYAALNRSHGIVVDPLKNYEGWRFDFAKKEWKEIPKSPLDGATQQGRYFWPLVVAPVSEHLFVWGDNREPNFGATLDFAANRWSIAIKAPIVERWGAMSAVIGSKVYVLGGVGANKFQTDGAVFDLDKKAWSTIPSPPLKLTYGMVMTQWRGKVIIAGGRDQQRIAIYDPKDQLWEVSADAPFICGEFPACVAPGDKLFLWSGNGPEQKLRKDGLLYDLKTMEWETVPTAPIEGRWLAFAAKVDEQAVVWGGWQSGMPDRFMRSGATFDPKTRKWRLIREMPGDVPQELHPGW